MAVRSRARLDKKKISRDVVAIILLLATTTPAAFHAVRAQGLAASITYTPTSPARTETVTFTGSATGGVPPYTFSWTLGDASTVTGSTVSHTYASSGAYTVNLTVTDSNLQQAFQAQKVIVTNYHGFSFGIASDIGNLNVGYSNNALYASRQSLLRLGNSTGLSFFIANGWFADGFYYRNEAAWCSEFKAHYSNIVLVAGETDTGWTSVPYSDIIYDSNTNGVYDNSGSGPDSILFNGWGGGSRLPGPVNGSPIASDNRIRYWDANHDNQWNPGEAIVDDDAGVSFMRAYYPVMVGPIPPTGTPLSSDPKLKYFQRDSNRFYVRPQTNGDFEQYVINCGFPSSLGTWHGSGINCGNALPGQPGYTFPTCYGREYYFDIGYPTPELRIVAISPTVQNITGRMTVFGTDTWLYQKNDAHYNWVNQTIQAARAAGIPQTMVVSFDQCMGTTVEECGQSFHHQSAYDSTGTQIEGDLWSLLLDSLGPQGARITYLVQGEDKGYSRFYPLATHPAPPFTSDGLGCLWDSATGNHGFPLIKYSYDTPADLYPVYNPACFANPQTPGQPYTPWPGLAGQGASLIISAAFGAGLYNTLYPGEILVKDVKGTGFYEPGYAYIGGIQPVPGTMLTGNQATNSHVGFIDTNGNGQWDLGETLFRDSDNTDGCTGGTTCNGKYDPGETVYSGPVPSTQQPAAFNDTDVKLIDTNGNGKWDRLGGAPHNVLETPYIATSMGANTPCNNLAYSTTCPGHGWVTFAFNPAGNQTNIDTNFCIDGERPTPNYASCISPHVYKDKYVTVTSTLPVQKGFSVTGSFYGVSATMAAYLGSDPAIMPTAWLTAANTSSAQPFVVHTATYLNVTQTSQGFKFVYQINTTTSTNRAQPWLAFACKYTPGVSNNPCGFQRTLDINHDGMVNISDIAACALAWESHPGDSKWNVNCDINNDGAVNIFDIANMALYFDSPVFTV
ncbi:PKD domain-containing protein [Candidatus Bathyarchaeota archaeon]|nr:MAG: PKD domain-containing protein [Candidatus Bathyarchaeota archaeon]